VRRVVAGDQRGTVAIVVALSLVLLLGFAALTVDVGLNWASRREVQNAADGAALAGAFELPGDPSGAVAKAAEYVADNVPGLTGGVPAGWASDGNEANGEIVCWKPPAAVPVAGAGCAAGSTAIQVITPPLAHAYALAGALGRSADQVKALAQAGVFSAGNILPWGLTATAAAGGEVCLKSGSGGTSVPPCSGPDSGNFQSLDSRRRTEGCMTASAAYVANVKHGVDHNLDAYAGTQVLDDCPASQPAATPNVMYTLTGNKVANLRDGLVDEADSRLLQPSALGATVKGTSPAWDGDFLDPADGVNSDSYVANGFFAGGRTFADYQACAAAPAGCGVLFNARIAASPRWGFVPVFKESAWPSGSSGTMHVDHFAGVFVERLLDNKGDQTSQPNKVEAVTAYVIPAALLPASVVGPQGGGVTYSGGPKTVHLIH
jgi:Putative Flp pilus-assembly TadE/G-like